MSDEKILSYDLEALVEEHVHDAALTLCNDENPPCEMCCEAVRRIARLLYFKYGWEPR